MLCAKAGHVTISCVRLHSKLEDDAIDEGLEGDRFGVVSFLVLRRDERLSIFKHLFFFCFVEGLFFC